MHYNFILTKSVKIGLCWSPINIQLEGTYRKADEYTITRAMYGKENILPVLRLLENEAFVCIQFIEEAIEDHLKGLIEGSIVYETSKAA